MTLCVGVEFLKSGRDIFNNFGEGPNDLFWEFS